MPKTFWFASSTKEIKQRKERNLFLLDTNLIMRNEKRMHNFVGSVLCGWAWNKNKSKHTIRKSAYAEREASENVTLIEVCHVGKKE
jgi:hypothetical protein